MTVKLVLIIGVFVFRYAVFRKLGHVERDSFRFLQVRTDSGGRSELGASCGVHGSGRRRRLDE